MTTTCETCGDPAWVHEIFDQDGRLSTAAALGWKAQVDLHELVTLMLGETR